MRADQRSTGRAPVSKAQTMIVVQAFKQNDAGEVVEATRPMAMPDERRAIARAMEWALRYAGAIAWKSEARADEGDFGDTEVLFSRGLLPDLDMPVRRDDADGETIAEPATRDGDADSEPSWMALRLAAAADWQAFHRAFLELYRNRDDKDLLAVFTALENRRIVLLPPEAAKLVKQALPAYRLLACERPPTAMISLELGHTLQLDTTWFELSAEERRRRMDATKHPA